MKKLLLCCYSVALLFLAVGHASAVTITQTSTFSGTSTEPNVFTSLGTSIGVTPFAPSLGTLNEVRVSIYGQTHVDFGAMLLSNGLQLVPYPVTILINNSFIGGGGKYFAFDSPAGYGWAGLANSSIWSFDNQFTNNFVFNDFTDLTGTAIPTITNTASTLGTPPPISGHLADFAAFPIDLVTFVETVQATAVTPIFKFDVVTNGNMTIEYDYTPSPAPVPEPATMLLLASGLAGLAGFRKRFKK